MLVWLVLWQDVGHVASRIVCRQDWMIWIRFSQIFEMVFCLLFGIDQTLMAHMCSRAWFRRSGLVTHQCCANRGVGKRERIVIFFIGIPVKFIKALYICRGRYHARWVTANE